MNFADTNWLVSIYIEPDDTDSEAITRRQIVSRFLRRQAGPLLVSPVVLLEARNIFSRITQEPNPTEWKTLESDFGGRVRIESIDWNLLQQRCHALFAKYSWKAEFGTFDTTIVCSAKIAGATTFLSFDSGARALASVEGLGVFPGLTQAEKARVARLKR